LPDAFLKVCLDRRGEDGEKFQQCPLLTALIGLPNGLAAAKNGAIYIGGNDDGSIWIITE
jgi:hypothetical protein